MVLKPRKKTPSRCGKCRSRKTFPMCPTLYERHPYCPCGGRFMPDAYRIKKEHKRVLCKCSGYEWSIFNAGHRMGSPKCYHSADGTDRVIEDGVPITIA